MASQSALAQKYMKLVEKYDKASARILELTTDNQRLRASYTALNVVHRPVFHKYLLRRCELLQLKLTVKDINDVEVRLELEGLM